MLSSGLSPWHLLLVLAVVVLVFGSKKLPDVARGLGQSMRILKAESKAMKEEGKSKSSDSSTAQNTAASEPAAVEPSRVEPPAATTERSKDEADRRA